MINKFEEDPQAWETLNTTYPFITPWFKVRQDLVRTHLNKEITYSYHDHPGCVLIVAQTIDSQVALLKHYRHPVQNWCWEVPAGRLQRNLNALTVAKQELYEEAGGLSDMWQFVGKFYTSTGSSNEQAHVYLATNVVIQPTNKVEPTELLEIDFVSWEQALEMANTGRIEDGPSALALFLCQAFINNHNL